MEGFVSVRLDQVQAAVRENPLTSVLVSIGAGVGLGWLCQAAWRDYRLRLQLQQFKDSFETESVAGSTPRSAAVTPRESLDGLGSPPTGNLKMVIAVRTDLSLGRLGTIQEALQAEKRRAEDMGLPTFTVTDKDVRIVMAIGPGDEQLLAQLTRQFKPLS